MELKPGMPADAEILLDEMAAGVPAKPGAKPGRSRASALSPVSYQPLTALASADDLAAES